jgi:Ca-activated chloride channel homolog
MDSQSSSMWKLILATFIALATTAAISVAVTLNWVDDDDDAEQTETVETDQTDPDDSDPDDSDPTSTSITAPDLEPLPDDARVQEPDSDDTEERARRIYDLPDHSGQLVAEIDDRKVGLPKIDADYRVDVRGDLATVYVKQSFENPTDSVAEPIYEFPLYEKAAVYAMSMKIGDRRVDAEIKRKEEAREQYEQAKRQGKKAALLDQDRPNLFVQRVANVEPGQRVEITLRYTHALPKDRGNYLLTVPLAIGERFTPSDMSKNRLVDSDGNADPGAKAGGAREAAAPENVSLSVRIDGGMPVSQIRSASHRVRVGQLAETVHRVELDADKDATDKHFRLAYRLAGDQPQVGVNSYFSEDDEQGYFDVLIEPPAEVAAEQVPNREVVFVVDKSGSMRQARMKAANDFIVKVLDHLRPDDHFRIIYFSNGIERLAAEPMRATPQNISRAKAYAERMRSGGGTVIVPPLKEALEVPIPEDTMRMVVVVTDVQVSNEFQVIETITEHIGEARMFALGIGGEVNRYLLDEIGRSGRGFAKQFDADDNVQRAIDDAVRRLQSPVLTDISVDWGSLEARNTTPERVPDVFEGGSVRLYGQYDNPGRHRLSVRGKLGGEWVTFEKEVDFADSAHDGEAVKLAWARQRIADRMHLLNTPKTLREDEKRLKEEITELGLKHSLTTQWTSFVAVDDQPTVEREPRRQRGVLNRQMPKRAAKSRSVKKSSGFGGLGLSGSGRGGGGSAGMDGVASKGAAAPAEEKANSAGPADLFDADSSSAAKGSVSADTFSVGGGLHKDIVKRFVRVKKSALKQCYERELGKDSSLAGSLVIVLEIGDDGRVRSVDVNKSTLGSSKVNKCLESSIKGWRFPEPDGGQIVKASFKLTFSS